MATNFPGQQQSYLQRFNPKKPNRTQQGGNGRGMISRPGVPNVQGMGLGNMNPRTFGRENAMTRGNGNQFGLERQMMSPTGQRPPPRTGMMAMAEQSARVPNPPYTPYVNPDGLAPNPFPNTGGTQTPPITGDQPGGQQNGPGNQGPMNPGSNVTVPWAPANPNDPNTFMDDPNRDPLAHLRYWAAQGWLQRQATGAGTGAGGGRPNPDQQDFRYVGEDALTKYLSRINGDPNDLRPPGGGGGGPGGRWVGQSCVLHSPSPGNG